ncbi:glycosyl hydrolase [Paenibacillus roseipurpureus]|uniref:Glycosyl hydrolase n=1 Tax=Paenibacillus roseopurpureus TaxID=2918901 RepID=A0AA96LRD3_9BACL|nr:glycosyl hydrolase [Paenibacillus sp. MBLB1832]WNR44634.1 glycosyl hydrolase [Paenibacillus sp. MBLB1832]
MYRTINQERFELDTFANPPAAYRSTPFWSWNDKLEPDELLRQIGEMKRAGLGGFFMHTRQGLLTPYMGDDFLDAVEISAEAAKEHGLEAWCYDENGWPSGTANGVVPALGAAYQQKSLEGIWINRSDGSGQLDGIKRDPEFMFVLVRGEHEQQWLVADPVQGDWCVGLAVMCRVNPYYIDVLAEKAMTAFLQACHEVYFRRLGDRFGEKGGIPGIFTDELKFSGVPWSDDFAQAYADRYGESVSSAIGWLLTDAAQGDEAATEAAYLARYRYWRLVSERFQHNVRLVADWCEARGWQLTGHFMGEDTLMEQLQYTAGVMPLYEHMHMPGIDMLGRTLRSVILPKQAASVARQLGKPFVITETFGCCGWNLSFREMKRIAQWQFVLGVNRLCPHLQSYSIRGVRKRDYPPSLYVQQPWWDMYAAFNDYFARLTYLLTLGKAAPGILVLHPIRTAWLRQSKEDVELMQARMDELAGELLALQRDFDYGDEALMRAHVSASGGLLHVGQQQYDTVIVSDLLTMEGSTFALLQAFAAAGGRVIVVGEAPTYIEGQLSEELAAWFSGAGVVTAASAGRIGAHIEARKDWTLAEGTSPAALRQLYVQERRLPGMSLLYVVHTGDGGSSEQIDIVIPAADQRKWFELDLDHGVEAVADVRTLSASIRLAPGDAKIFAVHDDSQAERAFRETTCPVASPAEKSFSVVPLDLNASWNYELSAPNVLTLDYARYRLDGGEWSAPTYVLKIQERCIAQQRPVQIELEFTFDVDAKLLARTDRSLWRLAIERPEHWQLAVNGQPVHASDADEWYGGDRSFPMLPIGAYVQAGRNHIRMSGPFTCSEEVYRFFGVGGANLAPIRNKLTFDVEIESLYVLGPFAVTSTGGWEPAERDALWTEGPFLLTAQPAQIDLADITQQGLTFYAGGITAVRTITLSEHVLASLREEGCRLILQWEAMRCPAMKLAVNSADSRLVLWGDNQLDLTDQLVDDQLELQIELRTSGRNTFGPHHHLKGEVTFVGPTSFTDKIGWVDAGADQIWTDRYCFVRFGLIGLQLLLVRA